jgi:hypothetical protein
MAVEMLAGLPYTHFVHSAIGILHRSPYLPRNTVPLASGAVSLNSDTQGLFKCFGCKKNMKYIE